MRYLIALLLIMMPSPLLARHPAIQQCEAMKVQYANWAIDFRNMLDRNSSYRWGRVDQELILDINFILASAKDFVHNNLQYIQHAQYRGEKPSVSACRQVVRSAQVQIESYARYLLSEVHPSDRRRRRLAAEEFRMGLRESTRRLQDHRG